MNLMLILYPMINSDNVGVTYFCANPVFYSCMKYMAIDFYFVHNQVFKKLLWVSHVQTSN